MTYHTIDLPNVRVAFDGYPNTFTGNVISSEPEFVSEIWNGVRKLQFFLSLQYRETAPLLSTFHAPINPVTSSRSERYDAVTNTRVVVQVEPFQTTSH